MRRSLQRSQAVRAGGALRSTTDSGDRAIRIEPPSWPRRSSSERSRLRWDRRRRAECAVLPCVRVGDCPMTARRSSRWKRRGSESGAPGLAGQIPKQSSDGLQGEFDRLQSSSSAKAGEAERATKVRPLRQTPLLARKPCTHSCHLLARGSLIYARDRKYISTEQNETSSSNNAA